MLWLLSHLDLEWALFWRSYYKVTSLIMFLYYLNVTSSALKNMILLLMQGGKWELDDIPV